MTAIHWAQLYLSLRPEPEGSSCAYVHAGRNSGRVMRAGGRARPVGSYYYVCYALLLG